MTVNSEAVFSRFKRSFEDFISNLQATKTELMANEQRNGGPVVRTPGL